MPWLDESFSYTQEQRDQILETVKGMAFVRLDTPQAANPTLTLPPGRTVEIELRNEDAGSVHNLVIPELNLQTRKLKAGQSEVLRFTVPSTGRLTYYCALHPLMMRGEIVLRNTLTPIASL